MTNIISIGKSIGYFAKTVLALVAVFVAITLVGLPTITRADTLYRQLELGMRGTDVSSLQTFLAQDSTIYPQGLVTGYFGSLTKSAVSNFQSRNGISTVGRVGPITMRAINEQMSGGISSSIDDSAPIIYGVNISRNNNSAVISWGTDTLAHGKVYYSRSPVVLGDEGRAKYLEVSGDVAMTDGNLHSSQAVSISGLQANTTYYYVIYTTDQSGNLSITWPKSFQTTI